MRRLARWSFNHRAYVAIGWVVALVGLNAIHGAVGSNYSNNFRLPNTDSFNAVRLLQRFRPELRAGYRMLTRQAPTLSPRNGMPMTMRPR